MALHLDQHVLYRPEVDSTNLVVREWLTAHPMEEAVVVRSDFQTAGRGQRGTHWESRRGKNLLFSIGLRPRFMRANEQFRLSQVAALAVAEAVGTYADGITVKWPNDIYYEDLKLCGMLLQHELRGDHIERSIVGIGINVNQLTFVSDAPNPVSLRRIVGREVPLDALLGEVLARFEALYELLKAGGGEKVARRYDNILFRRDKVCPYCDEKGLFQARIEAVEPNGVLCLRDTAGLLRRYAFKEVKYVLNPTECS